MSSERYARVKELFVAARLLSPEQRRALLDQACAGDDDLREEVDRLLLRHDQSPPTRTTQIRERASRVDRGVGSQVGPYALLQVLGEGGMGLVYLAEQKEPVHRRVALKLVKWGMDTVAVLARFDAERQALAMMDHPNIARVFDVGATEDGQPYFVMELVRGVPITAYCDEHRLSIADRLGVFVQVCHGVQHAHRKGIIHRDLKPSNVLLTEVDDQPVVKIIDFGVAKAVSQRLTEHSVFTELGQWIGTPEYMSPEQTGLADLDVDTRSDVYSLGVILYELLVGTHPLDLRQLRNSGFDEMRRKIREDEPPRPSTRLRMAPSAEAAAHRRVEPQALRRQLRGDLDWITMKALEKDRSRRYGSVSELAADVERHLRHEPVSAGPPSARYKIGKFARRHRVGVAAGTALATALLLGIAGTTIGLVQARRAQALAAEEAETAREVSEFLLNLFRVSDPSEARGNSITAREILDRGAEKVGRELGEQPLVQARMLTTIGQVYRNLGLYEEAEPLLMGGLSARKRVLGDMHPDVADSLHWLSWLYRLRGEYAEALSFGQQALEIREQTLEPDHPDVAWSVHTVGVLHRDLGDFATARQYLERALTLRENGLPPDHPDIARNLYDLGWLLFLEGRLDAAAAAYERALPILEGHLGADSSQVAWCLNDLGVVMMEKGDLESARSLLERAITIMESVLGAEHPSLAAPLHNLAISLWHLADFEAAGAHYRRALDIREETLGPQHDDVAGSLLGLALVSQALGDYEDADRLLARAIAILENTLGAQHRESANALLEMATLRARQGREGEADRLYQRSVAILGASTPGLETYRVAYSQACYWAALGRRDEALRSLERSLELGYSKPFFLSPNFDSLRGDPAYEEVVATFKRDVGWKR